MLFTDKNRNPLLPKDEICSSVILK